MRTEMATHVGVETWAAIASVRRMFVWSGLTREDVDEELLGTVSERGRRVQSGFVVLEGGVE